MKKWMACASAAILLAWQTLSPAGLAQEALLTQLPQAAAPAATAEPTAEPGTEPAVEPTEEPTAGPTVEPTAGPTVEPAGESTEEPTVEPEITVSASDYDPGVTSHIAPTFTLSGAEAGQAYGVRVNEGEVQRLSGNVYTADQAGTYTLRFVILGSGETVLASSAGYTLSLEFSQAQTQLTVTASGYQGSGWHSQAPAFTLACAELETLGLSYALRVDGGTPVLLSAGAYTPWEEGSYTLTFCLVDAQGREAAVSQDYPIKLDTTAPQVAAAAKGASLTLTCQDGGSGLAAFSLDNGATWTELEGASNYSASFAYSAPITFPAGSIQVRDVAGHLAATQEAVAVAGQIPGGGRRPGGPRGASRAQSHAASDTQEVVAYNGVALLIEEEPMTRLKLGGEPLEVTLAVAGAAAGSDYQPAFTARLAAWNGDSGDAADTLILTAVTEPERDHTYLWQFRGLAYKKLAASGIDYLAFQVGDQLTALSTAGFTAGLRYNLYKAAGLGSGAFGYQLAMTPAQSLTALYLTVAGDTYQVAPQGRKELYYYDLYTGNQDMLNQAFGAWQAQ